MTRPRMLTAAIIPRTAGTPNLPFRIGRTKTLRGAPILATPAANPLAVVRNSVGNKMGASVNVVELGPGGAHPFDFAQASCDAPYQSAQDRAGSPLHAEPAYIAL